MVKNQKMTTHSSTETRYCLLIATEVSDDFTSINVSLDCFHEVTGNVEEDVNAIHVMSLRKQLNSNKLHGPLVVIMPDGCSMTREEMNDYVSTLSGSSLKKFIKEASLF